MEHVLSLVTRALLFCSTFDSYCTISTVAGSRVTRGPSDDANWALVTGHGDVMLLDFGSRSIT